MNNVESEFNDVKTKYPSLCLGINSDNGYVVSGYIGFTIRIKDLDIKDYFNIVINIPHDYPNTLPKTREIDGRIPQYFHKYDNAILCLETPLEQRIIFNSQPTLLGYIENCLIPYLVTFHYWTKTGDMPYGERDHCGAGIIQSYQARLNVKDPIAILGFLFMLSTNIFLRRQKCLCGSGERFCRCHETRIIELQPLQTKKEFEYEYGQVLNFLRAKKISVPEYFVIH
ncbi:MAG TPA: hypothetical protein PKL77_10055 [Candidatus Omnitrophota bacterium]|nr:hypothetical protein [Candidatus Omnitrophota bacterium]